MTDLPHLKRPTTVAMKKVGERLRGWIETETIPDTFDDAQLAQLISDLEADGVEFRDPDNLKIVIHQNDSDTLHLALPSKTQLEYVDGIIDSTVPSAEGYIIDDAYISFGNHIEYVRGLTPPQRVNPATASDFYRFYLADYNFQHCM